MTWLGRLGITLILSSLMTMLMLVQPDQKPQPTISSPEEHLGLTAAYLTTIPEEARPYTKTFSFWDERDEERLIVKRRFLPFWINQMSFVRTPAEVTEIPGSKGRLFAVDIRDLGWTLRAWEVVSARDPFSREPWITYQVAETGRIASQTKAADQDKNGTRPVLLTVNGTWFFRETFESDRSPSYYDLLFAKFRHPDNGYRGYSAATDKPVTTQPRTETYQVKEVVYEQRTGYFGGMLRTYTVPVERMVTKTRTVPGGSVSPGTKGDAKSIPKAQSDFPVNVEELEKALFVDTIYKAAAEQQVSLDFGSIVQGGGNHPRTGSIVGLGDRLVVIVPGPFGWYMRTYDAFENTGDRDYSEVLFFKGGKFYKGDRAEAKFDAGEILYYLPNGGQAGMLIDEKGNRAEIAAQRAAQNRKDPVLNIGVRNYWDCATCHAPTGGFIPPKDIETRDRGLGIKREFYIPTYEGYLIVYPKGTKEEYVEYVRKGKEKEIRYKEFFDEWMIEAKGQTERYERLIARTTAYKDEEPWTGVDIAGVFASLVSEYDDEVTLARSAGYFGIPEPALRYLCNKSPKQRDKQLLRGAPVPIRTYEVDIHHRLGNLLDASRIDPTYKELCNQKVGVKP